MANTVDIQTIQDGPRNVVVRVFLASDGSSGDETDTVLVDWSALTSDSGKTRNPSNQKLSLDKISWAITGFTAKLEWAADTDVPFMHLSEGTGDIEMSKFRGIPNNAGTGVTNDLTITTSGFDTAGDDGVIIMELRKQ